MHPTDQWTIVDTETTGLSQPVYAVEIAAQRMRGWAPDGAPFQVLLNHEVPIDPAAEAVHGYSRAHLRRHGQDPRTAHAAFRSYAGDFPLVAYNLGFDWDRVLRPEYQRGRPFWQRQKLNKVCRVRLRSLGRVDRLS